MWLHTMILTLLFFLLSFGFGLFILSLASASLIRASNLNRLELLVLGLTVGAPGAGTFLELLSALHRGVGFDLAALSLTSLIGLVATCRLWRPRRQDLGEIALWIAIVVPLATITWWCSFGAFSRFPFTDIGAGVHWMKVAQEFADTGTLNPYANQTYVDLRAALAGLLSGVFGLNLLQFNWTYSYVSILCLGICFYAGANGLFTEFARKWFAVFFMASTNMLGLFTNGSLAAASSFVFLVTLLRVAPSKPADGILSASIAAPAAAALAGVVTAFLLNNNTLLLATLLVLLLGLNLLGRIDEKRKSAAAGLLVSAAWPMVLIFVHRSSYLFVLIVVVSWFFYLVMARVVDRLQPRSFKSLLAAALLVPAACVIILLYVAVARFGYLPKVSANALFSLVTQVVLGRTMSPGDEIMLGAGPEIAAIELGRALGPLFAIGIGLVFLWWCLRNPPRRLVEMATNPSSRSAVTRLLWSWIAASALSLAVLSGFPFMYRVMFIILGFFAIAATELFGQLLLDPLPRPVRRLRFVAGIAASLIVALTIGIYALGWIPDVPYSTYQAMFRPTLLAGLLVTAIGGALTLSGSWRMQIVAAAAVIGLSVSMDRAATANLLRVYSYGRPPSGTTVISHYDASDLDADHWLHDHLPKSIVVSDPITLAMAKAIAAVPGLYLFSNLDTVHDTVATQAKQVIAAVLRPEADNSATLLRTCARAAPLLSNLNLEAQVQMRISDLRGGIFRPVRPSEQREMPAPLQDAVPAGPQWDAISHSIDILQTSQGEWSLVAIINPRTIRWLNLNEGQRLSYFPANEPLDPDVLERLKRGPFRALFSDGQNIIVSIGCTQLRAP